MQRTFLTIGLFFLALVPHNVSFAGSFDLGVAGANPRLQIKSIKETRFNRIIKQQYDFSCGSAALATLLTYHYNLARTEDEVFLAMWEAGEQENIRERGFSLLDMQSYLYRENLKADGFQMTLERIKEIGVPGIALIEVKGYKHFVVIKGARNGGVLIGDPSSGMTIKSDAEFNDIWGGTIFFIRSFVDRGKRNFDNSLDWAVLPGPDYAASRYQQSLQVETLHTTRVLDSGFNIRTGF